MSLKDLKRRRAKRVEKRERHYTKYTRYRVTNKARARWHLKRFRWQRKAIRKLDRLIEQEKARIKASWRIDWNGCPALSYKQLLETVRKALTVNGLYVTATTNGTHSPTSWHYKSRAVDFGSGGPGETPEIEAQRLLLKTFGAEYFAELFGPDQFFIKNGVIYPGVFPGHGDHLHVAVA